MKLDERKVTVRDTYIPQMVLRREITIAGFAPMMIPSIAVVIMERSFGWII